MLESVAPDSSSRSPSPRVQSGLGWRVWRIVASPWCTLLLLVLLALVGGLSLWLPQAEPTSLPTQSRWLATLQGHYGRWTGLLSGLGFFDIAHALWFQVLLALMAYQSLVAAAEGCARAQRWLYPGEEMELSAEFLPLRARGRGGVRFPASSLADGVEGVQALLRGMSYRVMALRREGGVLLEAMRYPWLVLSRPLAHGGIVLACVAGLLGGRLDWQEGPITLSPGQRYELRRLPGVLLCLDKAGLASPSSQLYTWVSLAHGERTLCTGVISAGRGLRCGEARIVQRGAEPALGIIGYDRAGRPLAIRPLRGEGKVTSEIVLPMSSHLPDRYAVLPERGLMLHVELSSDQERPRFRLEVYRGQQSAPVLQKDILGPTSLTLEDLVFHFRPTRVPSLQVLHYPTRAFRWAGLALTAVGFLAWLALAPFHLWADLEDEEGEVYLRLWRGLPLPCCALAPQDIETWMASTSGSEVGA